MNRTLEGLTSALFSSWFVDFEPVQAKRDVAEARGRTRLGDAALPQHFEDSDLGPIPSGVENLDHRRRGPGRWWLHTANR